MYGWNTDVLTRPLSPHPDACSHILCGQLQLYACMAAWQKFARIVRTGFSGFLEGGAGGEAQYEFRVIGVAEGRKEKSDTVSALCASEAHLQSAVRVAALPCVPLTVDAGDAAADDQRGGWVVNLRLADLVIFITMIAVVGARDAGCGLRLLLGRQVVVGADRGVLGVLATAPAASLAGRPLAPTCRPLAVVSDPWEWEPLVTFREVVLPGATAVDRV